MVLADPDALDREHRVVPEARVHGRDRDRDHGGELVGQIAAPALEGAERTPPLRPLVVQARPEHGGGHRHRPVGQGRDDPEVPAPAAQPPEQVGVGARARGEPATVGRDHLGPHQTVQAQPGRAHEPAHPAAEGHPCHAGGGDGPQRHREAVRGGRRIDVAHPRPGRGGDEMMLRIDGDLAQRPQIEHDPVVDRAETGDGVASAAHRERKARAARGLEHEGDVGELSGLDDRVGDAVDHPVPHRSRLVEVGVARFEEPPCDPRPQPFQRRTGLRDRVRARRPCHDRSTSLDCA